MLGPQRSFFKNVRIRQLSDSLKIKKVPGIRVKDSKIKMVCYLNYFRHLRSHKMLFLNYLLAIANRKKNYLCFDIHSFVEHGFMLRSDFKQKVFIIPPIPPHIHKTWQRTTKQREKRPQSDQFREAGGSGITQPHGNLSVKAWQSK